MTLTPAQALVAATFHVTVRPDEQTIATLRAAVAGLGVGPAGQANPGLSAASGNRGHALREAAGAFLKGAPDAAALGELDDALDAYFTARAAPPALASVEHAWQRRKDCGG